MCGLRYTGVLISPWPDQEENKLMFLSEWRDLLWRLALQGGGDDDLMTARILNVVEMRASLAFFRTCFFPGRAKDLSALLYIKIYNTVKSVVWYVTILK